MLGWGAVLENSIIWWAYLIEFFGASDIAGRGRTSKVGEIKKGMGGGERVERERESGRTRETASE